eukprot:8821972-Pyramimonas_sp.AAC.1
MARPPPLDERGVRRARAAPRVLGGCQGAHGHRPRQLVGGSRQPRAVDHHGGGGGPAAQLGVPAAARGRGRNPRESSCSPGG